MYIVQINVSMLWEQFCPNQAGITELDQAHSRPRDWSLWASWGAEAPRTSQHYDIEGFKGTSLLGPIMSRYILHPKLFNA